MASPATMGALRLILEAPFFFISTWKSKEPPRPRHYLAGRPLRMAGKEAAGNSNLICEK